MESGKRGCMVMRLVGKTSFSSCLTFPNGQFALIARYARAPFLPV